MAILIEVSVLTAIVALSAFSSSSAFALASSCRTRSMFFLERTCQLQRKESEHYLEYRPGYLFICTT